ncbi:hypothetical protein M422DRAFT_30147 [Sphaerobolus stellatus SS14]|uniref:Uncharacterized protein n=1 Tax=Sphaerobolus stellatus (strain SS14) TaxID=990650 RepID=A0A0C9UQV4_SPHS4|nr:hypothetical protein M422DRAFT_30147 [Sphaerobolus stellatus SS14]
MNNDWSVMDSLNEIDPYKDFGAYLRHSLATSTKSGSVFDNSVRTSPFPASPSGGHQNNESFFPSLEVESSEEDGVQDLDINIDAETVEENIPAIISHLLPDSTNTSIIQSQQEAEMAGKDVNNKNININSPQLQEHTSHPIPQAPIRYSRLSKRQLPPHSYDLVNKHLRPFSNDPNGAHQCIYPIRNNSICRRSFSLKSEAKDHFAEDHFKKNTKFECHCWLVFQCLL